MPSDTTPETDDSDPSTGSLSGFDPGTDVDVPPAAPVYVCDRCGRPFTAESHLALHRGLVHPDDLSPAERDAFEAAHDEEVAALRRFRLLALAALVALYFGFLMTYAVVT